MRANDLQPSVMGGTSYPYQKPMDRITQMCGKPGTEESLSQETLFGAFR